MFRVIAAAEVAFDDARNTGGSPQLIVPTVFLGPLHQEVLQFQQLRVGQARFGSGGWFGQQADTLPHLAEPAGQRLGMDTQNVRNHFAGFTLPDQINGALTPTLQFRSCSNRSAHALLDAPTGERVLLPRWTQ